MNFSGLGRAVGRRASRRDQAVLARHEDHAAADLLLLHQAEGTAADQEVAGDQDVLVALPDFQRRVFQRRGRSDAGVGHEDVQAAEAQRGGRQHGFHFRLGGDVALHRGDGVLAGDLQQVGLGFFQRAGIDVGQHDAGPFLQQLAGDGLANATGAAGDQGHAAGQALGLGHALQLGFFEQPVLDVEGFLLGQADVGVDAVGAAHHVDGVDVELAGDAGGGLVLREGQHADAGDQVDDGVGIAHGRAGWALAALVVGAVVGAVGFQRGIQAGQHGVHIGVAGVEVQHQRADLGAQEVVGAGRAQRGQLHQVVAADELQHRSAVVEVAQLALVGADAAAQRGHQLGGYCRALLGSQRHGLHAAEHRLLDVLVQPLLGQADHLQRDLVAALGGVTPGEQAVAFQDDALQVRLRRGQRFQLQAQVVAGALPGQPAQLAAEDDVGQALAVGAGGDGDDGVRVHVVHMRLRDVGVQRGVDAGRARVQVERAVRQVIHHLVFMRQAAIPLLQRIQLVHVERGKTIQLDGAQVAARALDPQHLHVVAGQVVAHRDLGRGIAAAEIRHAQIRAQQIGAIKQQFGFAQLGRHGIVPLGDDRGLSGGLGISGHQRACNQSVFIAVAAVAGPAPVIGGLSMVETGRSVSRNTASGAACPQEIKRMSESAHRAGVAHETLTAVSVC